jgi:hypothetical protein
MKRVTMSVVPILGVPNGVQIRVRGDGVEICTEGSRDDAMAHAMEELVDEGDFEVIEIVDQTKGRQR